MALFLLSQWVGYGSVWTAGIVKFNAGPGNLIIHLVNRNRRAAAAHVRGLSTEGRVSREEAKPPVARAVV